MGTDRMHQVVLRALDNATAPVITAIRERKKSITIPIYKKRKKKDLENYMLISFAFSPGKMMD